MRTVTDLPPFLAEPNRSAPVSLLVAVEGASGLTASNFAEVRDSVVAIHPTASVEVVDDPDNETLGVVLWLGQPGGPSDAIDLEATTTMLRAVALLTADAPHELVVEMSGEPIGWIRAGHVDRELTEGLLDPWRSRRELGDNI